ncbi:hypothetical protein BABINDRAFT_163190 [Babjeviella inositovora NRRL Y-12698]|uniref:Uncharacterized protein n=1 Tax=Babjeviella inositovora NRRL Y-12698 TaxID=984486 RepID=A0A1E3QJB5_9ASCO|nr:uncharacterized protein BABINDRAFT_163190 [Babjeviella inositovora NRRL Y-12698]ODQ77803.1 hypothetical protein BABINDRAFT_163190 [Babjeviella inositovora NRRL Y-12698]
MAMIGDSIENFEQILVSVSSSRPLTLHTSATSYMTTDETQIKSLDKDTLPPRMNQRQDIGGETHATKELYDNGFNRPPALVLKGATTPSTAASVMGSRSYLLRGQDLDGVSVYFSPLTDTFPKGIKNGRTPHQKDSVYGSGWVAQKANLDPHYLHKMAKLDQEVSAFLKDSPTRRSHSARSRHLSLGREITIDQDIFSLHENKLDSDSGDHRSLLKRSKAIRRKINTFVYKLKNFKKYSLKQLKKWRIIIKRKALVGVKPPRRSPSMLRLPTVYLSQSASTLRLPRVRSNQKPGSRLLSPIVALRGKFPMTDNLHPMSLRPAPGQGTSVLVGYQKVHRTSCFVDDQNQSYLNNISSFKNSSAYFDTFDEMKATQAQYKHRETTPDAREVTPDTDGTSLKHFLSEPEEDVGVNPEAAENEKLRKFWKIYLFNTVMTRIKMRQEIGLLYNAGDEYEMERKLNSSRNRVLHEIRQNYYEEVASDESSEEADDYESLTVRQATTVDDLDSDASQVTNESDYYYNEIPVSHASYPEMVVKSEPLASCNILGSVPDLKPTTQSFISDSGVSLQVKKEDDTLPMVKIEEEKALPMVKLDKEGTLPMVKTEEDYNFLPLSPNKEISKGFDLPAPNLTADIDDFDFRPPVAAMSSMSLMSSLYSENKLFNIYLNADGNSAGAYKSDSFLGRSSLPKSRSLYQVSPHQRWSMYDASGLPPRGSLGMKKSENYRNLHETLKAASI